MEVSGQHYTLAASSLAKEPRVPLTIGLGGPQKRSGHFGEDTKFPQSDLEI